MTKSTKAIGSPSLSETPPSHVENQCFVPIQVLAIIISWWIQADDDDDDDDVHGFTPFSLSLSLEKFKAPLSFYVSQVLNAVVQLL